MGHLHTTPTGAAPLAADHIISRREKFHEIPCCCGSYHCTVFRFIGLFKVTHSFTNVYKGRPHGLDA